jgi:hypothetical protein
MIEVEKVNCGGTGFLGVSDVASVSDWVIGSRGDFAERYREVQLNNNKLSPKGVLLPM